MFHGSIVALVTPMDDQGEIDLDALHQLVEFHVESGSRGIVVAGTTGEAPTLANDEFKLILTSVVEQVDSRVKVLAGTGGNATSASIEATRIAVGLGADGVLVVTPYYNRPMQSGLLAHFNAIADATEIPIVLYNVPGRTAVDLLPETVAELAQREEIVAIKEALPDIHRIQSLVSLCGDSIVVLSGDDPSCLEAMQNGARGVISVAANVVPGMFSRMWEHAADENWQAALEIDEQMRHLYELLALETNPIPVKWALYELAMIGKGIRLPLLPLDEKHHETMRLGLKQIGLR